MSLFQGLWRWAVWLPRAEGVAERGGSHSVHQADPGGGELPPRQKNCPLWPQGWSITAFRSLLHCCGVFKIHTWAVEEKLHGDNPVLDGFSRHGLIKTKPHTHMSHWTFATQADSSLLTLEVWWMMNSSCRHWAVCMNYERKILLNLCSAVCHGVSTTLFITLNWYLTKTADKNKDRNNFESIGTV